MSQPGYQEGSERTWWWRVAQHLDSAQIAAVNAMVHNLEDQTLVFALGDKLREAQVILLEIFRTKGLLPGVPNGGPQQAADAQTGVDEHGNPIYGQRRSTQREKEPGWTQNSAPFAPPQPPPQPQSQPGMAFPPPPPPPPPFASAPAPFAPPPAPMPASIGDVHPPTAATTLPPMIVTNDIPLVSETDP